MFQEQMFVQSGLNANQEYYAPCQTCEKHPRYTQAPVTLHKGGLCLICSNIAIEKIDGKKAMRKAL